MTSSEMSAQTSSQPVALVVGASRGLGLLVARELAARGCRTVLCARDAGELDQAVELMSRWGHKSRAIVCDVTDHHGVEALVAQVERSEERRVGKECRSRWSPYH